MKFAVQPLPKPGDKRTRKKFAFLPYTLLQHDTVVWLEYFEVVEEFMPEGYDSNPHWSAVAARPLP